ncbi:MAG: RluA family pseudouridine synthase [Tenericutes bacterium]|nr:RluA family pseudouridine synthase [Mycoplasmatota bacterium]
MNVIVKEETKKRIDLFLSEQLPNLSRSKIQKLIKEKQILVNNNPIIVNYKINFNDNIFIPEITSEEKILIKEDIPLDIIYEDQYLLIINKKSGMVVHPAPGNYSGTLVNALLSKVSDLSTDDLRPGIVHRLDKDTSGLMLVAKNDSVYKKLSKMIKKKEVERLYLALVEGVINHETGTIDAPIGRSLNNRLKMDVTAINSKDAITHFKVLERFKDKSLIECQLVTGRTHQIRVHLAYIGHPVVGDPLYGKSKKKTDFNQLLHSYKIKLNHPITNQLLAYTIPLPMEFQKELDQLH